MPAPIFTPPCDLLDRTPLNTEVWLCPQCNDRADLELLRDGVLLRCAKCGLVRPGNPVPNFDVD